MVGAGVAAAVVGAGVAAAVVGAGVAAGVVGAGVAVQVHLSGLSCCPPLSHSQWRRCYSSAAMLGLWSFSQPSNAQKRKGSCLLSSSRPAVAWPRTVVMQTDAHAIEHSTC